MHLVRCLKTISDQYFPRTQTLAVAWTRNDLLYCDTNTPGMATTSVYDGQNRRYTRITYDTERYSLNNTKNINEFVDLLFSELNSWTVVVYGNTVEHNRGNYDVCGSYIVLTAGVTVLSNQLQHLSNSSNWNPRARIVIALLSNDHDRTLIAQRLLEEVWKHKIINALVLVPNEEGEGIAALNAYTWYPYQSAGQCMKVKDITLVDIWAKKGNGYFMRNTHLFRQKMNKKLHACPIRIVTQETIFAVKDPYYLFVNRSNTIKLMYRNGWEVKLLKIITKAMNMTEHYLDPITDFWNLQDNEGNYAGFTRELMNDRADVAMGLLVVRIPLPAVATTPYHWGKLSWYVPCGSRYPRWMSISRMFPGSVWALLMLSVILTVPVVTFLARISGESFYMTGSNTFFSTWASILSVAVPAMPRTWPLRGFFISWVCYSLAVDTVFQTYLTSFLIDPGIMPHPRNLEELARSDMKLGFASKDGGFYQDRTDAQARHIMAKKVECDDADACYIWAKKYKNLSILTSDILYKFQSSQNLSFGTSINSLCQIDDGVVEHGPIVMVLAKGSFLLDRINNIICQVVEAGIFGEWVKMTNHIQMVKEKASFPGELSDEYYKLSLEHLQSAFYLLLFGYCLSFFIFITENAVKSVLCSCKTLVCIKN